MQVAFLLSYTAGNALGQVLGSLGLLKSLAAAIPASQIFSSTTTLLLLLLLLLPPPNT
jgi:hypothetical protein